MNKSRLITFACCALGFLAAAHADEAKIEFKRVSVAGQFDNGQIIGGHTNQFEQTYIDRKMDGAFFSRTGVWITQDAVVNDRLELIAGVGGVFWYALPTTPGQGVQKQTQFGPGISQAQGIYSFGDLSNPVAKLQMGFFPYKYNDNAKNLGEYLLRSGTYPGYVVSGGWNMISSAAYMVQGFRLNVPLWGGKAQVDFLLPMERDLPPLFSLSPTLVATVRPLPGFEIGAGATCNHCIAIKPSEETPHVANNRVITGDSVIIDTAGEGSVNHIFTRDSNSYYTFQGVKLMANASFDPKAYVPMPYLGSEDLKIYGEIALLGVKNYGYMYDDRTQRMPVMLGVNLPTFKLLDVLSFEGEYYNSRFTNDITNPIYRELPIWNVPDSGPLTEAQAAQAASDVRRDNWKWSIYGKKEVTKGIEIYAQAASDHIRTFNITGGPFPATVPVTNHNGKEWYYIVRLQFGI